MGHTLHCTFRSLLGFESSDRSANKRGLLLPWMATASREVISFFRQCIVNSLRWECKGWCHCGWGSTNARSGKASSADEAASMVKKTQNLGAQCPSDIRAFPLVPMPSYRIPFFPNQCPHFNSILTPLYYAAKNFPNICFKNSMLSHFSLLAF